MTLAAVSWSCGPPADATMPFETIPLDVDELTLTTPDERRPEPLTLAEFGLVADEAEPRRAA